MAASPQFVSGTFCCFTWNNPEGMLFFDEEEMNYLVYQEEVGESGTYHFQGYCEFKKKVRRNRAKTLLGGPRVHIEKRLGTQAQAIEYCKRKFNRDGTAKRIPDTEPIEEGTPRVDQQGKRNDLEAFKDAVRSGARARDLIDEYYGVFARFQRFYATLTSMSRPVRTSELAVTLLYGPTGLGKTRYVTSKWAGDDEFWQSPLSNGTAWFDAFDRHKHVLLDDFSGAASHFPLCSLLQLLDRYPIAVPTKGSHTWWLPDELYVTTNILPRYWYKWENRGEHYKALARRFHSVHVYHVPLPGVDSGFVEQLGNTSADGRSGPLADWWQDNAPVEADYS